MTARRYVFPRPGDDLAAIATRELGAAVGADGAGESSGEGDDERAQQLLSWNLHLAARRATGILPSDIVFTEPPQAR